MGLHAMTRAMATLFAILFLPLAAQASTIVTGSGEATGPHSAVLRSTATLTNDGAGHAGIYYILYDVTHDVESLHWGGTSFNLGAITGTWNNTREISGLTESSTYNFTAAILYTESKEVVALGETKQFTTPETEDSSSCVENDITLTSQADVDNFQQLFGGGAVCTDVAGNLLINNVSALTNLDGLFELKNIGGNLEINNNDSGSASNTSNSLTNLYGLSNLMSIGGYFQLTNNSQLKDCRYIAELLGWPSGEQAANVGGYHVVSSNAEGCNSVQEIYNSASLPTATRTGPIVNQDALNGIYFDSSLPGHGFDFKKHQYGLTVFYYGHTYEGQRLWLISDLYSDFVRFGEQVTLQMNQVVDGTFGNPQQNETQWGTLTFQLSDCDSGTALLNGNDGDLQVDFVRLVGLEDVDCDFKAVNEIEPNESAESATVVSLGETLTGNLSNLDDVDWYAVDILDSNDPMAHVVFDVSSVTEGLWSVEWFDPNMQTMSGRNISAPDVFEYDFPAFTPGRYTLRISYETDFLYSGASYRVTLTTDNSEQSD